MDIALLFEKHGLSGLVILALFWGIKVGFEKGFIPMQKLHAEERKELMEAQRQLNQDMMEAYQREGMRYEAVMRSMILTVQELKNAVDLMNMRERRFRDGDDAKNQPARARVNQEI